MDITAIHKRLQKLLALSSSPNEAEASLAMEKASEIMQKYNIRSIDVDIDKKEAGVTSLSIDGLTKKFRPWEAELAAAISKSFDGKAVIHSANGQWQIIFVATTTEIVIISDLFKRLRRTVSVMASNYALSKKAPVGVQVEMKVSYALGMTSTIYERLLRIYGKLSSSKDLILVKTDAIDKLISNLFGSVGKSESSDPTHRSAFLKGVEDGHKVSLNRSVGVKHKKEIGE